jgi:hypothetical protein
MLFIIPEDSTEDFVAYLRSAGIERTLIRRAYDHVVFGLRLQLSSDWESEREYALPFFQSGFTDLDNAGVDEVVGTYLFTYLLIYLFIIYSRAHESFSSVHGWQTSRHV